MTPTQQQRLIGAAVLLLIIVALAFTVLNKVGEHQREKDVTLPEPIDFTSVIEPLESTPPTETMVDADTLKDADPLAENDSESLPDRVSQATEADPEQVTTSAAADVESEFNESSSSASEQENLPSPVPTPKPVEKVPATPETAQSSVSADANKNETALTSTTVDSTSPTERWQVQLGSFSVQENALTLQNKAKQAGFEAHIEKITLAGVVNYRVRMPSSANRSAADDLAAKLAQALNIKTQVMQP
ncbi:putative DedD protein [Methylophaga frappieri]|jgi:DedD protein|uniref:Putative DedD protein n=1 Tax=Methylophaga frappieri (strain ATCC BAA-2434 / DSM 25690 / JAM7) TaxID=754477 RepID=I1YLK1_METFJ|nr:SPOR domain-containing protein [Methylophaga frappieri]AFJ03794.1 putative DedD protein [Methylophaga frappieri]